MKKYLQIIYVIVISFAASSYFTALFLAIKSENLAKILTVANFGLGGLVVGSLMVAFNALQKLKNEQSTPVLVEGK